MAEAVADNILLKIQQEAYKSKEASEHHESLSDKLSGMLMGTDDMKTAFVKAAEEEAAAQIEKSKQDEKDNKAKEEQAEAQRKRDLMAMSNFEQLASALKSQSAKLGDALKEDFKQITGGLSLIAEAPGVKSIIAIITAMASTLGSLLLINIKNSGILGKTIGGLIKDKMTTVILIRKRLWRILKKSLIHLVVKKIRKRRNSKPMVHQIKDILRINHS